MNCNIIQRNLLECENPHSPDAEVQEHLGSCQPCHDWHQRLVQIEVNAPRVPVPPSTKKADFLAHLVEETAAATVCDLKFVDTPVVSSRPPKKPSRPARVDWSWPKTKAFLVKHQRYVSIGLGAAAVIMLFVTWSLFSGKRTQSRQQPAEIAKGSFRHDPLVAKLVQSNLSLAQADSFGKRADALRRVATDLHKEAESVANVEGAEGLHQDLDRMGHRVNETLARIGHSIRFDKDNQPVASEPTRVAELKRNQTLIESLVNGALKLASEVDPLRRADSCAALVVLFSGELNRPCDRDRILEMGHYLQDVLRQGVAKNLSTVKQQGLDADKEREVRRIVSQVAALTQPIEQQLDKQTDTDLRKLQDVIRARRTEVENVLRS